MGRPIYPIIIKRTTSGGGGSTGPNQQVIWQGSRQLTGNYVTGGFTISLSSAFTLINFANIQIETPSALPGTRFEYNISGASLTVKIMKHQYTRAATIGNVTNQPGGVSVLAASGGTSSSEASHTHSTDHDHPSFASGAASTGAGQVLLDALGPSTANHTHTVDYPNLAGTSGAGTSHNHTDNTLYSHGHSVTQPVTSMDASTQLANGTSLSGIIVNVFACGVSI